MYKPTNIQLKMFKPNMTSFIQPLDAGVICCFKAHYQRAFCLRAIELDKVGEDDIYKINLLEVMLMAKEAWASVSADTIRNCWNHAFASPYVIYFCGIFFLLNATPIGQQTLSEEVMQLMMQFMMQWHGQSSSTLQMVLLTHYLMLKVVFMHILASGLFSLSGSQPSMQS